MCNSGRVRLAADSDYIVSGDKHLLDLKCYGSIKRSMLWNL